MGKVSIYTISDRKTGYVYYVGATEGDLNIRFSGHRSEYRLECLKSENVYPVIEEIDVAHGTEEAREMENYWVWQMRSWGFNLENRTFTVPYKGDTSRVKKSDRRYMRISLDKEQYEELNFGDSGRAANLRVLAFSMIKLLKKLHGVGYRFALTEHNKSVIRDHFRNTFFEYRYNPNNNDLTNP